MEIAGKILKGALKATVKVDWNSDGNEDGSASASIPDLNLPEYLKNTSGLVLIFDDVERCSIKLPDLLGYINHFVEHQNYKVILVANEEELLKDNDYKAIKEKLIGKTFEITPQVDGALDLFIVDAALEQFYETHRELIKETHANSNYKNLRHLRQALLDFARLERKLPEEVTQSTELMAHFLRIFLIFTIEIRHGEMIASDIRNLKKQWVEFAVAEKRNNPEPNFEKPISTKLVEKYRDFDAFDILIEQEVWVDILGNGIVDGGLVFSQLKNSKYLVTESSPNWVRLWNFRSHTDDEFSMLVSEVWDQFQKFQFTAPHEIKHILGMMLFFSENGLLKQSINSVIVTAKNCVDFLRKNGHFKQQPLTGFRDDESAMGMGYFSFDREEFREFCRYLKQQQQEAYIDTFSIIGSELLSILKSAPSDFSHKLHRSNYGLGTYHDIPILLSIPLPTSSAPCQSSRRMILIAPASFLESVTKIKTQPKLSKNESGS